MEDPGHSGGRALVGGGGGRSGGGGNGGGGSAVFGTDGVVVVCMCAVVCFAVRVGGLVGDVEKIVRAKEGKVGGVC